MSLKARFRRIEAGVRWLETEGVFINIEARIKLLELLQEISDRTASDPAAAERWKEMDSGMKLPPPRVPVVRRPPPVPAPLPQPILPGVRGQTPPAESHAAPRPEKSEPAPPRPAKAPPPGPPPIPGMPVEPRSPDLEMRPVQWRPRGAGDDYGGEGGTYGRCLTECDPLRDEDDDDG